MKIFQFDDFMQNFDLPEKMGLADFKDVFRVRTKNVFDPDTGKVDPNRAKTYREYLDALRTRNPDDFRIKHEDRLWGIFHRWYVTERETFLARWFEAHISITRRELDQRLNFKIPAGQPLPEPKTFPGKNFMTKCRIIKNLNFNAMYQTAKLVHNDDMGILNCLKMIFENHIAINSLVVPMGIKKMVIDDYHNMFAIIRGTVSRPSVFNPYTYAWILDTLFKGTSLFTPVLAWNSYQLAFHNSPTWREYVGTDVIPSIIDRGREMAEHFNNQGGAFSSLLNENNKRVELYCCPSEQLDAKHNFIEKYRDHFDGCLFSPPYFNLEIYASDNQSVNTFPDYDKWLVGYWRPTCELVAAVMKPGARVGFVVSDFKDNGKMNTISKDMAKEMNRHIPCVDKWRVKWDGFSKTATAKMKDGNFEDLWLFDKK